MSSLKIIGVIPARFASSRFPGKMLVNLCGKPMLQWVIESVKKSSHLASCWVATDHQDIFDLALRCGVKAVMTSPDLASGTDRIFQATKNEEYDVAINIQGDEPLLAFEMIDELASVFLEQGNQIQMASLGTKLSLEELNNPNVVKVIRDVKGDAIYFSRFPIPHSRLAATDKNLVALKHVGMYGYQKVTLKKFCTSPVSACEQGEALEQLRALEMGIKIRIAKTEYNSLGVDTPEDLIKAQGILQNRRI